MPITLPAACLTRMPLLPVISVILLMDTSPIRLSRITEAVRIGSIPAIFLIFPDIELISLFFISLITILVNWDILGGKDAGKRIRVKIVLHHLGCCQRRVT